MSGPGIASGITHQGEFKPDNLIAGDFPQVSRIVTVTGNTSLMPGAVLGRINADDHYQLSKADSTDGSEIPDGILAEVAELNQGDVEALVYLSGEFNELALILGAGHTLDSVRQAFRTRSVFLRNNQP